MNAAPNRPRSRSRRAHMLDHLSRSDFGAIDIALRIDGDAFRRAGALEFLWIGYALRHLAIIHGADAYAAQPTGIAARVVRFRIRDINQVVAYYHAARTAEVPPLGDEAAVLIDDLHTVVAAVGDEQPSLCVHRDVVRRAEFTRPAAVLAEGFDELAVFGELRNSRHGIGRRTGVLPLMAFGDEDVAVGRDDDTGGLVQRIGGIARDAGLA